MPTLTISSANFSAKTWLCSRTGKVGSGASILVDCNPMSHRNECQRSLQEDSKRIGMLTAMAIR